MARLSFLYATRAEQWSESANYCKWHEMRMMNLQSIEMGLHYYYYYSYCVCQAAVTMGESVDGPATWIVLVVRGRLK